MWVRSRDQNLFLSAVFSGRRWRRRREQISSDFSSEQGAFSQEYFVYFKRKQRSAGGKALEDAEADSPEFASIRA
jgi:hypothetical protein